MNIEWRTCIRIAVTAFGIFLAIHYWSALSGSAALIIEAAGPLLIGGAIAYIVNILMSFYERYFLPKTQSKLLIKIRRPVCLITSLFSISMIFAFVIRMVVPELLISIQAFTANLSQTVTTLIPEYTENPFFAELIPEQFFTDILNDARIQELIQQVLSGISGAVGSLIAIVRGVFSTVVYILISLIFSIYILSSKEKLGNQITTLMKTYMKPSWHKKTVYVLSVLNNSFRKFIVGQFVEAVILGVLCTACMLVLNFPYATLIGTIIGFTALIPIVGAYLGAGVGAFMILTVSPSKALLFLAFILVLQQLENNLIYPKVVGASIGLPGIWVLCAITLGGALMGVHGIFIAVPIASAAYQLIKNDINERNIKRIQKWLR